MFEILSEPPDDFCVFILTHGRPDNLYTYRTLKKLNYTGPLYIIIDDEDPTADRYRELYGDQVIMFSKAALDDTVDTMDNLRDRRCILYARTAVYQIARDLGYTYFLQLDDDYNQFRYRFDSELRYSWGDKQIRDLNRLFTIILEYYKNTGALSIALAQGGDVMGGHNNYYQRAIRIKRKAMNTLFCSVERPIEFIGRMNEDVTAYAYQGHIGGLFITIFSAQINQLPTQSIPGGMSEMYENWGTYHKAFYTVMRCPSFAKVWSIGSAGRRIHHHISWNLAVPKILDERYRKRSL